MVVIIASLFLPFQPQFEINASTIEAEALVESQPIKIRNAGLSSKNVAGSLSSSLNSGNIASIDLKENLTRRRSGSSNSRSSFVPFDLTMSAPVNESGDLGHASSLDGSQRHLDSNTTIANPQISSESFMESLTANATNTGAVPTPANPVYNNANASVEEFFSSTHSAIPSGVDAGGSPDSNISLQSSPVVGVGIPYQDSTTNLLKTVNRSLLYQTVLNESNSSSALEGNSNFFRNSPGSTVITPRSRLLPESIGNGPSVAKAKTALKKQQQQVPAIKHVRRKSSTSTSGQGSKLKFSSHKLECMQTPIHESESDMSDEEYYDPDELDSGNKLRHQVPKFGGYSNNDQVRNTVMMHSQNIFSTAPWRIVPCSKGNGGLKNAVSTALLEKTLDEQVTWVGTVGIPTDSIPEKVLSDISGELYSNFHSIPVITDDLTFKGAYKNFCKQILWPTLHYQIPDNPNSKAFEDHSWNYYQQLNQLFADKIVEAYKPGDVIWIHDYHLMLVPEMIRAKIHNAKIGFFLHISFPSSEVFRCFAQREKILNGLLAANSIGFQTQEYARHFMQTATRLLMIDADDNELRLYGGVVKVNSIPIGVDAFNLDEQINSKQVHEWRRLIRDKWSGKRLIVCRDQFDRIRGLKKKMLAYERFLRENPNYLGHVVMIQICLGTARDTELERDIMSVVDRINALSSDISVSQPVVFLHQDLEFSQYLALNCEADLFIVSSMREGMNLTCHEFIVCSRERNAPLLLSEFTGSARILKDGALLINPWDIKSFASSIKTGLELSPEEKKRRWKRMFKCVVNNDSDNWVLKSLGSINSSWEFNNERSKVFSLSYELVYSSFVAAKKHLFLLKLSQPPTPRMLKVISDLSTNNIVYVMNSMSRDSLERLYSRISNVGLIAENGAYVRLNGNWFNLSDDVSWKQDVLKVLEDKMERLPGSYCKIGDSLVKFHTENAEDKDRVGGVVGEAMTHINTLFGDNGIHAYVHKDIVFVQKVGLALKALNFVIDYHTTVAENAQLTTPLQSPDTSPLVSPVLPPIMSQGNGFFQISHKKDSSNRIQFLTVTGSSSPVLEPLFEKVNQLVKSEKIQFGFSIVYGDTTSTYAKEHVKGLNELFNILEKLAILKSE